MTMPHSEHPDLLCRECPYLQREDAEWGVCVQATDTRRHIALFLPGVDCPIGRTRPPAEEAAFRQRQAQAIEGMGRIFEEEDIA